MPFETGRKAEDQPNFVDWLLESLLLANGRILALERRVLHLEAAQGKSLHASIAPVGSGAEATTEAAPVPAQLGPTEPEAEEEATVAAAIAAAPGGTRAKRAARRKAAKVPGGHSGAVAPTPGLPALEALFGPVGQGGLAAAFGSGPT